MIFGHKIENKNEEQNEIKKGIKSAKVIFEERIQALRNKGKKRGKRYSFIGITVSLVIFIFSMVMGYILFEQISQISKKVSVVNIRNNFQELIDPNMRCQDSCCFASLEKMRKYNYEEVDVNGNCKEGFQSNSLRCELSLIWCEPIIEKIR